ncbi:MAG: hypothetical protein HYS89_01685 [Candidatus Colwellbacteria bacterium]|nr:hypothetical protein [Candidatus Colwellbacteria bacterium]
MIILLYGLDSYRRLKKLAEITEAYRSKYTGLSHERFDLAEEGSFPKFLDFVTSRSMFDPVKLVVLDNIIASDAPNELKEILKTYAEIKDTTVVVNSETKPPVKFKFLFEEPVQVQEFPAPKEEGLDSFIKKTASAHELKLDEATVAHLAAAFGSDTWALATEIERLALASNGAGTPTKTKDLIEKKPTREYYPLINSVKWGRSRKERLVALERILSERRDEPARVFNTLAYRLKDEKEAKLFADYDVAVKSGKLEYEEILLDLALGPDYFELGF